MAVYRHLGNLGDDLIKEILKNFPEGYSIKVDRPMNERTYINLFFNGRSMCIIDSFPNNCSWLILGNFNNGYRVYLKDCFAIAEEISKHLLFKVIFISDIVNSPNLQIGKEVGYIEILQNMNYHSDNEVILMAKELDFKMENYE
jgi:hypothetical protein